MFSVKIIHSNGGVARRLLAAYREDGQPYVQELAKAQKQLDTCQWLIPALTGGISVLGAVHGEQQRPGQQLSGILAKPGQLLRAAA